MILIYHCQFLSFLNFKDIKSKNIEKRNKTKKKNEIITTCVICSSLGKVYK